MKKLGITFVILILAVALTATGAAPVEQPRQETEKSVGAYVEFGAIGPVPDGVNPPEPGVTYIGTERERRDAAIRNILEEYCSRLSDSS